MMHYEGLSEAALHALAARLAPLLVPGDVVCLHGTLGAGKTSFARALLHGLGLPAASDVPSPTFTLVNSYAPPDVRLPVAHIDFYRLDAAEQVIALGLDDMLDDHVLVIEWPERWGAGLPAARLDLSLAGQGDTRTVELRATSADWAERLRAMDCRA